MDDFQKHLRKLRGSRAFAAAFDKKRAALSANMNETLTRQ
jgi:hypothetical protein